MNINLRNIEMFDLDNSTINSDHRVQPCMLPNGDLDLQMYIDTACTHELIMQDTLLPLAAYMQSQISKGNTVVIVTARFMNDSDYYFLRTNKLNKGNVIVCSRDRLASVFGKKEGKRISSLPDAEYKRAWFTHLWHSLPNSTFTMYDDHQGVLAVAQEMAGFTAVDAVAINKILEQGFADAFSQGEDYSDAMINSYLQDLNIELEL